MSATDSVLRAVDGRNTKHKEVASIGSHLSKPTSSTTDRLGLNLLLLKHTWSSYYMSKPAALVEVASRC